MLCGFTQPWKVRRKVISTLLSCPFLFHKRNAYWDRGFWDDHSQVLSNTSWILESISYCCIATPLSKLCSYSYLTAIRVCFTSTRKMQRYFLLGGSFWWKHKRTQIYFYTGSAFNFYFYSASVLTKHVNGIQMLINMLHGKNQRQEIQARWGREELKQQLREMRGIQTQQGQVKFTLEPSRNKPNCCQMNDTIIFREQKRSHRTREPFSTI